MLAICTGFILYDFLRKMVAGESVSTRHENSPSVLSTSASAKRGIDFPSGQRRVRGNVLWEVNFLGGRRCAFSLKLVVHERIKNVPK